MVNTIFVCDSPYQVIAACCIQYYRRTPSVLILTNHVMGMDRICDRMRLYTSLFKSVYYVDAKKYENGNEQKERIDFEILNFLSSYNLTECKEIVIGSLLPYMLRLFKVFKCDLNQSLLCGGIIEDGFSTYSIMENLLNRYKYKFDFKKIYLYNPSLLAWKPDMDIVQINKSCFLDNVFCKELNNIFAYYDLEDAYDEKFIFLESSYEEFSQIKNLREILLNLSDIVGKENIIIKNHPRTKKDIYKEYGFKTNSNSLVPWEIIALNRNLSDKIIISTYSGAIFTPCILFEKEMTGIILMRIVEQEDPLSFSKYYQKYVLKQYQQYFFVPNNVEEYRYLITKLNKKN